MEYIVKAKDLDIEINNPKIHKKDRISWIILISFAVIGLILGSTVSIGLIFIILLMVFGGVVGIINNTWTVKVKDRKVYIKKIFLNTIIDYPDLINVGVRSYQDSFIEGSRYYLKFEYIKNNKFKFITLRINYPDEILSVVYQFCGNFITNKQLSNNSHNEYIDIREFEITEMIKNRKQKEYKRKKVVIIIGIILFILMIISIPFL